MSTGKNDIKLEAQIEQLSLQDNSKYIEDILDDALLTAMKGEHKAFCLKIESVLIDFIKSPK